MKSYNNLEYYIESVYKAIGQWLHESNDDKYIVKDNLLSLEDIESMKYFVINTKRVYGGNVIASANLKTNIITFNIENYKKLHLSDFAVFYELIVIILHEYVHQMYYGIHKNLRYIITEDDIKNKRPYIYEDEFSVDFMTRMILLGQTDNYKLLLKILKEKYDISIGVSDEAFKNLLCIEKIILKRTKQFIVESLIRKEINNKIIENVF